MSRIPNIMAGMRSLAGPPLPYPSKSEFFLDRAVKVYLRVGPRFLSAQNARGWFVTLASIDVAAADRRQGLFKEVLTACEDFVRERDDLVGVYVECVNNEDLRPYLRLNEYAPRPETDPFGDGTGADWIKIINLSASRERNEIRPQR